MSDWQLNNVMDADGFIGWRIEGALIHTPYAFPLFDNDRLWFAHFEATFPDRAQRLREYSRNKGWCDRKHVEACVPVCRSWVRKHGEPAFAGDGRNAA